jgi:hypothetical protein
MFVCLPLTHYQTAINVVKLWQKCFDVHLTKSQHIFETLNPRQLAGLESLRNPDQVRIFLHQFLR